MKKILILGGSGFIGRNLVEYFIKQPTQYDVSAPSIRELDLMDSESVDSFFVKHNFDVVIFAVNYGNYRVDDPSQEILKKNLMMFFNLVKKGNSFGRMIFLGSGAEYDRSRDVVCAKESDFGKNMPSDDYGFYKYVCSKYIENSSNILNLRLFGVFGKYEDYSNRFISNMICRKIKGLPLSIKKNRVMSYVYVDDLAKIIEHFILNVPRHKFYNVSSGENLDLVKIAEIIRQIHPSSPGVSNIEIVNEGFDKVYTCDFSLLTREVIGVKITPMIKSIHELYAWYVKNIDSIKEETL
jgi:GDP-L-fucose synthase